MKENSWYGNHTPNGGQLSVPNVETWNSWRNVKKGIKWLTQADAPLKINLTPTLDKYSWFVKFLAEIKIEK